jgi:hypothetical protein
LSGQQTAVQAPAQALVLAQVHQPERVERGQVGLGAEAHGPKVQLQWRKKL